MLFSALPHITSLLKINLYFSFHSRFFVVNMPSFGYVHGTRTYGVSNKELQFLFLFFLTNRRDRSKEISVPTHTIEW